VADALEAFVIQHNRAEDWARYRRPQRISGITHVIVNRDSRACRWWPSTTPAPAPTCGCTTVESRLAARALARRHRRAAAARWR